MKEVTSAIETEQDLVCLLFFTSRIKDFPGNQKHKTILVFERFTLTEVRALTEHRGRGPDGSELVVGFKSNFE